MLVVIIDTLGGEEESGMEKETVEIKPMLEKFFSGCDIETLEPFIAGLQGDQSDVMRRIKELAEKHLREKLERKDQNAELAGLLLS